MEILAMKNSFLFFMYIFTSKHFDCISMDHWLILREVFLHKEKYVDISNEINQCNPMEMDIGTWESDT